MRTCLSGWNAASKCSKWLTCAQNKDHCGLPWCCPPPCSADLKLTLLPAASSLLDSSLLLDVSLPLLSSLLPLLDSSLLSSLLPLPLLDVSSSAVLEEPLL